MGQLRRYSDGLHGRGSLPGIGKILSNPQRPDRLWGPPNLLASGYRRLIPWVVKRPRREADHSPPSTAEVKNVGAMPPLPHVSLWNHNELSTGTTLPYL
jgi:hypothetical protein